MTKTTGTLQEHLNTMIKKEKVEPGLELGK